MKKYYGQLIVINASSNMPVLEFCEAVSSPNNDVELFVYSNPLDSSLFECLEDELNYHCGEASKDKLSASYYRRMLEAYKSKKYFAQVDKDLKKYVEDKLGVQLTSENHIYMLYKISKPVVSAGGDDDINGDNV